MQTELISISKAFTENLYRIPDYQRGYSWGKKQLKDFWNDILQLEDNHNHYTGVLTLESVPRTIADTWEDDLWIIDAKHYRPYFVVDGQQRLTTAIILIQAILERTPDEKTLNYDTKDEVQKRYIFMTKDGGISRSYIFGYEKDNPSYEFLKTQIFLEQSDHHSTSEDTIYTQNLATAKEFFLEKIKDYTVDDIEKLYTKITQNLLFNIFTIREDIDVFVTFETMNNRGKPLSHLELLKNRLIYLSTKFPPSENPEESHDRSKLRRTINECWKSAYHYLGKQKQKPLSDDIFLLIQFYLYFNAKLPKSEYATANNSLDLYRYRQNGQYKDYLLEEVFTANKITSNNPENNPLTIESIYDYAKDIKNTVKIFYEVSNPKDSKFSSLEKIYLERISRLRNLEAIVLLSALYKTKPNLAQRTALLEQLERTLFFKTLKSYMFHEIDLDEEGVRLMAAQRDATSITKILSEANDRFVQSSDFIEVLRNLGKGSGYYGWDAVRYFLFEYEQYLQNQTKSNREKLSWDEFSKEDFKSDYVTIEHIYPQKAADRSWVTVFNQYSIKQRNALKHSLGNLVPLSIRKNSSLGNKSFEEKKGSKSQKIGFSYGCHSEIEVAHELEWTPIQILNRGLRLLSFMEQRWTLNLGTDADKAAILGLDFVYASAKRSRGRRDS